MNACDRNCFQKHICGPGTCQPGDCFKCDDPGHSAPNNQPPFAHPGGPYGARVGQGFQLYGTSSSDPDGFLTRYLWRFSDGSSAEGAIVNQLYWSPGDHQVWLTVVDNKAKHATAGTTISITRDNLPPTVSVGGPDFCTVPCTAALSAAGSDPNGDPLMYTWYGCASGSGPSASCEVTGPRPVVAAVMANDSWGGTAWGWKTIRPTHGSATVGVFRPTESHWYLRNANTVGAPDAITGFGALGDLPVVGDWDGDGTDTLGLYRPSERRWYLRNSNAPGNPDLVFDFGMSGDVPIVGDWDGDGIDSVGVFRPSTNTWYLRNANSAGAAHITFSWGNGENRPVVGDWDGDGIDTVGMYRASDSRFRLHLGNAEGTGNIIFNFGQAGDRPIVGDWDGDGIDTIGVFRPSEAGWHLRNQNSAGAPDVPVFWYGVGTDMPVTGNWNGQ